jgi:hypothetical protein
MQIKLPPFRDLMNVGAFIVSCAALFHVMRSKPNPPSPAPAPSGLSAQVAAAFLGPTAKTTPDVAKQHAAELGAAFRTLGNYVARTGAVGVLKTTQQFNAAGAVARGEILDGATTKSLYPGVESILNVHLASLKPGPLDHALASRLCLEWADALEGVR